MLVQSKKCVKHPNLLDVKLFILQLFVSGSSLEGSKCNLKFQSAMWPQTLSQYFFFLLHSFHSPWIIVIVINYIDKKKNSIAICFFWCCHSIIGGQGGFVFSCCHNYNKGKFGFVFFIAISIVGGGIYLHFLSWCNDEEEQ